MVGKEAGASSPLNCGCASGFYLDEGIAKGASAIEPNNVNECQRCPPEAACEGRIGLTTSTLPSKERYWRQNKDTVVFYKCLDPPFNDCIGGGSILDIDEDAALAGNVTTGANFTNEIVDIQLNHAKELIRSAGGALRFRFRVTKGAPENDIFWCLSTMTFKDGDGASIPFSQLNILASSTNNAGTELPSQLDDGQDTSGQNSYFCTRRYDVTKEGPFDPTSPPSSQGFLEFSLKDGKARVLTEYEICFNRASWAPRGWILEVSAQAPVHAPNEARMNTTKRRENMAAGLPFVPVSFGSWQQQRTSLKDSCRSAIGDHTCITLRADMGSILSGKSISHDGGGRRRGLWPRPRQRRLLNASLKSGSLVAALNKSSMWEVDMQCAKGNTGPLCSTCKEGWARDVNEVCVQCTSSAAEGRRRLWRADVASPMRELGSSAASTNYINGTNTSNITSIAEDDIDDGQSYVEKLASSAWERIGPSIGLAIVTFFLCFAIAMVGMTMPLDIDESDNKDDLLNLSDIRNQFKILVSFSQVFSNMGAVFVVSWPESFANFMRAFNFVNLDLSSIIGQAIDPCSFNVPFLEAFAIYSALLPGFIVALFCAYYFRGHSMVCMRRTSASACCRSKYCRYCREYIDSGAGQNTAIILMAKSDVASAASALDKAVTNFASAHERMAKKVTKEKEDAVKSAALVKQLQLELKTAPAEKSPAVAGEAEDEEKEATTRVKSEVQEELDAALKAHEKQTGDLDAAVKAQKAKKKEEKVEISRLTQEKKEANLELKQSMQLMKQVKEETKAARDRLVSWINQFVFLVFPGLSLKTFQALRCRLILDKEFLAVDLAQECWTGAHGDWGVGLAIFMVIAVCLGIPVGTFILLYRVKDSMHDKSHPLHMQTSRRYGSLYEQYERKLTLSASTQPRCYFF